MRRMLCALAVIALLIPAAGHAQTLRAGTSYPLRASGEPSLAGTAPKILVADFDGDGLGDVAVIEDGALIFLKGDGAGHLSAFPPSTLPAVVSAMAAGKYDGVHAGMLLIGKINQDSDWGIFYLAPSGNGQFTFQKTLEQGDVPVLDESCRIASGAFADHSPAAGDDFALYCGSDPGRVTIFSNQSDPGQGTIRFTSVATFTGVDAERQITALDAGARNATGKQNILIESVSIAVNDIAASRRIDIFQNDQTHQILRGVVPSIANVAADATGASGLEQMVRADGDKIAVALGPGAAAQYVTTWPGCKVLDLAEGDLEKSALPGTDIAALRNCSSDTSDSGEAVDVILLLRAAQQPGTAQ